MERTARGHLGVTWKKGLEKIVRRIGDCTVVEGGKKEGEKKKPLRGTAVERRLSYTGLLGSKTEGRAYIFSLPQCRLIDVVLARGEERP